jgi:hemoglobin-like flavoprotein
LVLQPVAAPNGSASCRIQDRLTALRNFFAVVEPKLPAIFAVAYQRLFEVEPGLAGLFKGGVREHLPRFFVKLQGIVKLTRSSQLWPAGAATGQMLIPDVANFGRGHASFGVQPVHFSLMNDMLSWTCKEAAFEEFTPLVEEGLAFVFDVLGASLTARESGGDVLSKLRSRWSGPAVLDPSTFFDDEMAAGAA